MSIFDQDFLTYNNDLGVHHLKAPCKFIFKENIIEQLKKDYLSDEEIGGIIWVKNIKENGETKFVGDKISYVDNRIEEIEKFVLAGRTKKTSYYPDQKQRLQILNEVFKNGYFPIEFHTHPTEGSSYFDTYNNFIFQRETSPQDRKASKNPITFKNNKKILFPQALILGNGDLENELFIGLYGGVITPTSFKESKQKTVEKKIQEGVETVVSTELSKDEKMVMGIVAAIVLGIIIFAAIKYPKQTGGAIFTSLALAPVLIEGSNKENNYFNHSRGEDLIINIPHIEKR